MATLYHGDCLDELRRIQPNSVDLIYLDPPFFTGKKQRLKTRDRTKEFSFDDIWGSREEYAQFLYERILPMKALLKDTGSIFVHCDRNATHIIRAILDSVFGERNFQSEIIWTYKRWSNERKRLMPAHQTIYFYSKSGKPKFKIIYNGYSESTNIDQILQKRARDEHNKSIYARDEKGNVITNGEKRGVPLSDVWDIPYLNPKAKERVGYPTQKPVLLMERIIELTTGEGDLVIDPFCGSGSALVAATLMNRISIGIDTSEDAIKLSRERLNNPVRSDSNLLRQGREAYRTADEHALSLLNGLDCIPVHRNKGIDAILKCQYQGSPVLIRIQKKGESLGQALSLLSGAMKTKSSKKSFLVKTQEGLIGDLKPIQGIEVVDATTLTIEKVLSAAEAISRYTAAGSRGE